MAIVQDWQYEPDLSRVERAMMYRHVVFAILCVPLYMVSPTLFGLLIGPYVMWMIFSAKPALLLPLMIHMIHGSQQRYLALLACFLYSLLHIESMSRRRILLPFLLYLLSLPFFIWYTIMRYRLFGGGIGSGGTFEGLGYYLGLSAFFWGFLAIGRIPPTVMKGFIVLCFVNLVVHFLFFLSIPYTRFLFWTSTYLVVFLFWFIFQKGKQQFLRLGFMGGGAFVIMMLGFIGFGEMGTTFTLIATVCLSVLYLLIAKHFSRLLCLVTPVLLLPLFTIWMFNTMDKWYIYERGHGSSISYSEIKVRDWESLKYKLFRKTMTDRAPVWYASWQAVQKQFERDPIWVDVMPTFGEFIVDGNMNKESREVTLEIAAHNMLLEMLRLYGLWGGLGIYLVFIILPSMRIIRDSLRRHIATPYAPILACCVAHIVIGGQTGQYPISPQFTFYLFGLMGICAGHKFVLRTNTMERMPYIETY